MNHQGALQVGLEPYPGYRLERFLGHGGFGEVWEARNVGGDRVALKFLMCDNTGNVASENHAIQAIGQLQHPNLLRVDRVWTYQNYLVIAMALADGSLLDLLAAYQAEYQRAIPPEDLLPLLEQAAAGLDFLNAYQHRIDGQLVAIQHCDIKPGNLLLFDETLKISDFSLACVTTFMLKEHRQAGTLEYMAPEVFQGRLSKQTDQYALAVTYCRLRTGRSPFGELPSSFPSTYRKPAPDLTILPHSERPAVERALAVVPNDRWESCTAMIAAIRRGVKGLPVSNTRRPLGFSAGDTSKPSGTEKRSFVRYSCGVKASWRLLGDHSDDFQQAEICEISRSGVGLIVTTAFKRGAILAVKLKEQVATLSRPLLVRVVHARKEGEDAWRLGCSFVTKLSEEDFRKILP